MQALEGVGAFLTAQVKAHSSPSVRRSSPDLEHIQSKIRHTPGLVPTLAAVYYVFSFGYGFYIWFAAIWLCCRHPVLLLPLATYMLHVCTWGAAATQAGAGPAPLKRWAMWRAVAAYFPARLHKTADLPPHRPYVFVMHPHGILSFSAWLTFATEALGFDRLFPGIRAHILTLRINFRTPFLREYLLLHGVRDVSKRSCLSLLSSGESVMIAVGGATESLYAKPGANDLVLKRRRGFVKVAMHTGAALVPVYGFGENATFRTVNELPSQSALRRLQRAMTRTIGFTFPLYFGRIGLLPFGVPLDVVVGAPLALPKWEGPEEGAAYEAAVDRGHAAYCAALHSLFEQHRERYAKGEAGLQLVE
ncbi:Diacylglycerol acyltransferase [Micractinium conductrix]|uniref:Acyltransferase n=1 Tax=Micractinium conductrix TaxID=554055 RepID=A0A2P6V9S7_9CHLO|nr:Diacylglycerol acyltransferase [Micractinium conductrix]|eukprot:PSC70847.1 Diacylglycerol acyltransferase [Micractinium conductrix]